MKATKIAVLGMVVSGMMFLVSPKITPGAEDGAALFKTKCAPCHGADGTGKPAVKAPSLVSDDAKKLTDADLTDMIANGGKEKKATHAFSKKGLTEAQIKSLVNYIRELQKK